MRDLFVPEPPAERDERDIESEKEERDIERVREERH
jgi:hypothetical protein